MFWEYLQKFWQDWITRMGVVTTILFPILSFFLKMPNLPGWIFWFIAVICFFFTSYRVWSKDRTKLSIDIQEILTDSGILGLEEKGKYITIKLLLVNTTHERNAIKLYK